jgi:hypothetical protein
MHVQQSGLELEADKLLTRVSNRSLATVDDWSALKQYVVGKGDLAMPILADKNVVPTILSLLTETRTTADRAAPLPSQTASIACWLLENLSDDKSATIAAFTNVLQHATGTGSQYAMVADTACTALRRLDPTADSFKSMLHGDGGLADLSNMYASMVDNENKAYLLQTLESYPSLQKRLEVASKPFVELMNAPLFSEVSVVACFVQLACCLLRLSIDSVPPTVSYRLLRPIHLLAIIWLACCRLACCRAVRRAPPR